MPTGNKVYNVFDKRVMTQTELQTRIADYIRKDIVGEVLGALIGAVDPAASPFIGLSIRMGRASGQNPINQGRIITGSPTVDEVTVLSYQAIDGKGNLLRVATDQDVVLPNILSTRYHVGSRFAEVVDSAGGSVIANPRISGQFEYDHFLEEIGETGDPDNAFDDGDSTMTFVVDGVTEVGVGHNLGEVIRVWLKNPVSNTTWFEDLAVQFGTDPGPARWAGSKNFIETVGTLGQGASPSTTAVDYTMWKKGPSWFEEVSKDLSVEGAQERSDYIVHGIAIGTGVGSVIGVGDLEKERSTPMFHGLATMGLAALPFPGITSNGWFAIAAGSGKLVNVPYDIMAPSFQNLSSDTKIRSIVIQLILRRSGTPLEVTTEGVGDKTGYWIEQLIDSPASRKVSFLIRRSASSGGGDPDEVAYMVWAVEDTTVLY